MKKVNLSTKKIQEFTSEDTIYITVKYGDNSRLCLCHFVKYDKGIVHGKVAPYGNSWLDSRFINKEVSCRLEKCALYGSGPGDSSSYFHWFGSMGYAMYPGEEHKVLESGDIHVSKHPSFGIIRASRMSTSPKPLFGSSIKAGNVISLTISKCVHERDLNHDWFHDDGTIIEVVMSQNQFSDLITSLNYGSGVPCTIAWKDGECIQSAPYISKIQVFQTEFENKLHNLSVDLKQLVSGSIEMLKNKDSIGKKDRAEIVSQIESLIREVEKNLPYVSGQFIEQMDKTVTEAKAEVESFINHKIQTAGLESLRSDFVSPSLPEKNIEDENN